MKKTIAILLSCFISFNTFAAPNDILPSVGNTGIRVQPATQNGVSGSVINFCNYDQKLKKFYNCMALSSTGRVFYTQDELRSIQREIYGEMALKIGGATLALGIAGALIGTAVGSGLGVLILTTPGVSVGAALAGAGVGTGIGAIAGTTIQYFDVNYTSSPIIKGAVKDENVIIEQKRFNEVFNVLKEKLNELQ